MNKKITVGVFTGNRAEYGLQLPLLRALSLHPDFEYRLIVSGAHLDSDFGDTLSLIKNDGFEIHETPAVRLKRDDLFSTAVAIGEGIKEIALSLNRLKPDFVAVYADRFEGFAAVVAASQMNIPVIHIEGGDLTEGGALDDSIRHAMTKLSHIHFTTNEEAYERVLRLGEEPWRVCNVGLPSIDLILEKNYSDKDTILERYGLTLDRPIVLFTLHSVTTAFEQAQEQIQKALVALEKLVIEGCQVLITYPNNDAGGRVIIDHILKFQEKNLKNIQIHKSLGMKNYHGVLALAQRMDAKVVCVGNSSSGLKETAIFHCPVVNIGSRQDGRLRGENVYDCSNESDDIYRSVNYVLSSKEFQNICKNAKNPYGNGGSGEKMVNFLAKIEINKKLIQKKMTY